MAHTELNPVAVTAARLLRAIKAGGWSTRAELAEKAGKDRRNLSRDLTTLAEAGLVDIDDDASLPAEQRIVLTGYADQQLAALARAEHGGERRRPQGRAPLSAFVPNPANRPVTQASVLAMADTIEAAKDVLEAVMTLPADANGARMLLDGETRWRGALLLEQQGRLPPALAEGLKFEERAATDAEQILIRLVTQARTPLPPLEDARQLLALHKATNWSAREIAKKTGRSPADSDVGVRDVQDKIRIAKEATPDAIAEYERTGSWDALRESVRAPKAERPQQAVEDAIEKHWNTDPIAAAIEQGWTPPATAHEAAEAQLRRHTPAVTDWPVTADTFPTIHKAFELISHDSGASAGHETYYVPNDERRDYDLDAIEAALAELSTEDLETFCIGYSDDVEFLTTGTDPLAVAHNFLEDFFNDWSEEDDGKPAGAAPSKPIDTTPGWGEPGWTIIADDTTTVAGVNARAELFQATKMISQIQSKVCHRVRVTVDRGGPTLEVLSSAIPGAADRATAYMIAVDDVMGRWPAAPRKLIEWLDRLTGLKHVVAGKLCGNEARAGERRRYLGWEKRHANHGGGGGAKSEPEAPAAPAPHPAEPTSREALATLRAERMGDQAEAGAALVLKAALDQIFDDADAHLEAVGQLLKSLDDQDWTEFEGLGEALLDSLSAAHRAIEALGLGEGEGEAPADPLSAGGSPAPITGHDGVARTPSVPVRKSITPERITCLEDGRRFVGGLRRHLLTRHNLTAEQYRARWGLPRDYPMVAPNHAKRQHDLLRSVAP